MNCRLAEEGNWDYSDGVFLIKIEPSISPAVDFFLVDHKTVFVNESFLDPDLKWWLLVVGIREYNSAVKKPKQNFQTTSCNQSNQTALFPHRYKVLLYPLLSNRYNQPFNIYAAFIFYKKAATQDRQVSVYDTPL